MSNNNPQEFQTNDKGLPTGILLRGIDKLEERLTVIYPNGPDKDPNYVICRWENKNSVWILNHVYTLGQETILELAKYIKQPEVFIASDG